MKNLALGVVIITVLFFCSSSLFAATALEYSNHGDTLLDKGDYAGAMKYYSHAAKTDPKLWQAYKGISSCFYQQGDNQKALKYINHAAKLNPADSGVATLKREIEAKLGGGTSSTSVAASGISGEERGGSDDFKKLVFGFRLGAAGSLVGMDLDGAIEDTTTSVSIGGGAGVAAIIRYRLSDKLSIQAEPGFAKKAWIGAYTETNPLFPLFTEVNTFTVAANYLELPILFGVSPSGGGFRPVFLIGPYLGFKISSSTVTKYSYTDIFGIQVPKDSKTTSEGLKSMDMGLLVGLSLEFGRFILDGRYGKGFTSVYDSELMTGKATSYHFGIGWLF